MRGFVAAVMCLVFSVQTVVSASPQKDTTGTPQPVPVPPANSVGAVELARGLVECVGTLKTCRVDKVEAAMKIETLELDVVDLQATNSTLSASLVLCEDDCQARLREAEEAQGYSLLSVVLVGLGALTMGIGVGIGVGAAMSR